MALPTLLNGSENWTLAKYQASPSIQAAEIGFSGAWQCILQDRKRNVDVRHELNIMSILDRIVQYRLDWL